MICIIKQAGMLDLHCQRRTPIGGQARVVGGGGVVRGEASTRVQHLCPVRPASFSTTSPSSPREGIGPPPTHPANSYSPTLNMTSADPGVVSVRIRIEERGD